MVLIKRDAAFSHPAEADLHAIPRILQGHSKIHRPPSPLLRPSSGFGVGFLRLRAWLQLGIGSPQRWRSMEMAKAGGGPSLPRDGDFRWLCACALDAM